MLEYKGYQGAVEPEDGSFFGRAIGLRDVITFEGESFAEVEQAFHDSIDDYLAFCAERGEQPDRSFNGRVPLRLPPELHRRAATRAEAEGISLNQWIAKRIKAGA
ncbi:type II toxin-antitoxin system HicB family antitoxin [Thiohalocapsa sp. ML1]|uniref:type II toxin-antitoxin system HicB family antitoxin n=1 Tax=Thiohalocapsa sp. ML1 TaxID=1431688 RepID=UPI0007321B3D|nr:type II toxin-antitoxin system HicB family antitoxin [Thiohalocapsa sp. ML1]